jgi:hypothetical protein
MIGSISGISVTTNGVRTSPRYVYARFLVLCRMASLARFFKPDFSSPVKNLKFNSIVSSVPNYAFPAFSAHFLCLYLHLIFSINFAVSYTRGRGLNSYLQLVQDHAQQMAASIREYYD